MCFFRPHNSSQHTQFLDATMWFWKLPLSEVQKVHSHESWKHSLLWWIKIRLTSEVIKTWIWEVTENNTLLFYLSKSQNSTGLGHLVLPHNGNSSNSCPGLLLPKWEDESTAQCKTWKWFDNCKSTCCGSVTKSRLFKIKDNLTQHLEQTKRAISHFKAIAWVNHTL